MQEEEAELLRKAGYTVVSDAETETKVIGGNMPNPFRSDEGTEEDQDGLFKKIKARIQFCTKFDIVELDAVDLSLTRETKISCQGNNGLDERPALSSSLVNVDWGTTELVPM
jgi:hypothetical protein